MKKKNQNTEPLRNKYFGFNEEAFQATLKPLCQKTVCCSSLPLGYHLTQPPEKAGNIGLGLREETVQKTLGATEGRRLGPKIWTCLTWSLHSLAPGGFAPYLLLWGQSIAAPQIEYNR